MRFALQHSEGGTGFLSSLQMRKLGLWMVGDMRIVQGHTESILELGVRIPLPLPPPTLSTLHIASSFPNGKNDVYEELLNCLREQGIPSPQALASPRLSLSIESGCN